LALGELEAREPVRPHPALVNADFRPTLAAARTFSAADMTALWIGLVVCVPSWHLAGGLVALGMSWWQGVLTVFAGNLVCLVPMVLNAAQGTRYGVPFPVLARSSFGVLGAHVPSLLRGVVACGWFGIQTWVGGESMRTIYRTLAGAAAGAPAPPVAGLGISLEQLGFFAAFWCAQVAILVRGMESIRLMEKYAAPVLVTLTLALLGWAVAAAGGLGPMLSMPSQFGPGMPRHGEFWGVFVPAVTAQVGFWATLSLNIPDFSRFATSQRAQLLGQAFGLPVFMALFTFVGLAVTSATVVIYGAAVTDPIALAGRMGGPASALALVGLILATVSTNIAANCVGPANALVNLAPQRLSFAGASLLTAAVAAVVQPWRLIQSTDGFIFTWLVGYSGLLGPIVGVMTVDYYLFKRGRLDIDSLYRMGPEGQYWYTGGVNLPAIAAVLVGSAINVPGFLRVCGVVARVHPAWDAIYSAAWFSGTFVAAVVFYALTKLSQPPPAPAREA